MKLSIQRSVDHWVGLALIHSMRLPTFLIGLFLTRDHAPQPQGDIVIVKIRGGGSLLVALPALLSIKKTYPNRKLVLICSRQIVGFAKLIGCFDRCDVVDTDRFSSFLITTLKVWYRNWCCDTVIDFEIHSKLTTVFCLLLAARNRFGFYMGWDHWKGGITTHSLFFNEASPIYLAYQHVARVLGAEKSFSMTETSSYFRKQIGLSEKFHSQSESNQKSMRLALAVFSSDLCPEREYSAEQWAQVIINKFKKFDKIIEINIFGGPSDVQKSEEFIAKFSSLLEENQICFKVISRVGKLTLPEVAIELDQIGTLFTIDSGLNHIARLLGIQIFSYWGPTDPVRLLNPFSEMREHIHYKKIYCSPCVHATQIPPCHGDNICMKSHLSETDVDDLSLGWLVSKDRVLQ